MKKDFILDQISWITQVQRNYDFDSALVFDSFWGFINFAQLNRLTTGIIFKNKEELTEESNINRSDLTEEGYEFYKMCYDKYCDGVIDRGKNAMDYELLERYLKKLRG